MSHKTTWPEAVRDIGIALAVALVLRSCAQDYPHAHASECPETKMVNVSQWEWDLHDKEVLIGAKKRCPELSSNTECLKLLKKFGKQSYTAICGAPGLGEMDKIYPKATRESEIEWKIKSKKKKSPKH